MQRLHEVEYLWWKAGWVETVWISTTVLAMLVILLLMKFAVENHKALVTLQENGLRQYAARTQVIREILRFTITLPLLAIGIRQAMLPNYEVSRTADYYFFIACLMTVPVGMAIKGIVDWYRFTTLLRAVELDREI